jgi:xylulokinase
LWLQTVSDIGQIPQIVPSITLGASYGDAFLAGMGAGVFSDASEINTWLRDSRIVEPNPEHNEIYDKYMNLYLTLYQHNKELMHSIGELV